MKCGYFTSIVALLLSTSAFAQETPHVSTDPSWQRSVVCVLQHFKQYPASAQGRNEQGVVLLSFSLDRNGHVLEHGIARSSGYADLDNEVMAMIMRAEPLPPFPTSMPQPRVDLTMPIRFSLSTANYAQPRGGGLLPNRPPTDYDETARAAQAPQCATALEENAKRKAAQHAEEEHASWSEDRPGAQGLGSIPTSLTCNMMLSDLQKLKMQNIFGAEIGIVDIWDVHEVERTITKLQCG